MRIFGEMIRGCYSWSRGKILEEGRQWYSPCQLYTLMLGGDISLITVIIDGGLDKRIYYGILAEIDVSEKAISEADAYLESLEIAKSSRKVEKPCSLCEDDSVRTSNRRSL